jgi:hypothetical protein
MTERTLTVFIWFRIVVGEGGIRGCEYGDEPSGFIKCG